MDEFWKRCILLDVLQSRQCELTRKKQEEWESTRISQSFFSGSISICFDVGTLTFILSGYFCLFVV